MDTDEQETNEAATEVEESMSVTYRLEELRKEGGDKWLAILNADQRKVSSYIITCRHCTPIYRIAAEKNLANFTNICSYTKILFAKKGGVIL